MANFDLQSAITLFEAQTTTINGLWTVYVVATFAAGGFAALGTTLETKIWVAVALSIAFFAFTFGNWRMLASELEARWQLSIAIRDALQTTDPSNPFKAALVRVADTASEVYKGRIVHVSIDICVFIAIWVRVFKS